jgi:hypothetical protein
MSHADIQGNNGPERLDAAGRLCCGLGANGYHGACVSILIRLDVDGRTLVEWRSKASDLQEQASGSPEVHIEGGRMLLRSVLLRMLDGKLKPAPAGQPAALEGESGSLSGSVVTWWRLVIDCSVTCHPLATLVFGPKSRGKCLARHGSRAAGVKTSPGPGQGTLNRSPEGPFLTWGGRPSRRRGGRRARSLSPPWERDGVRGAREAAAARIAVPVVDRYKEAA